MKNGLNGGRTINPEIRAVTRRNGVWGESREIGPSAQRQILPSEVKSLHELASEKRACHDSQKRNRIPQPCDNVVRIVPEAQWKIPC